MRRRTFDGHVWACRELHWWEQTFPGFANFCRQYAIVLTDPSRVAKSRFFGDYKTYFFTFCQACLLPNNIVEKYVVTEETECRGERVDEHGLLAPIVRLCKFPDWFTILIWVLSIPKSGYQCKIKSSWFFIYVLASKPEEWTRPKCYFLVRY